jgi:hypothetical protein
VQFEKCPFLYKLHGVRARVRARCSVQDRFATMNTIRNTSTPNLARIARDPRLYDEAMRKIEQHVGYPMKLADTSGYAKAKTA